MRVLVIDVAAEHGGALSILNQYVDKFKEDKENEYIVCVGNLNFEDTHNVRFLKFPWVKRSKLHRMYFDSRYVKKIVKKYSPDRIFSLQNKAFKIKNISQEVYFHNALFICEKRFKLRESKKLWLYQNVISRLTKRSLKYADKILVQAEWIKSGLSSKWNIDKDKIEVERPNANATFEYVDDAKSRAIHSRTLFYPANFSVYKNHITLIKACKSVWDTEGKDSFDLLLTGQADNLPESCKKLLNGEDYPIKFLGRLNAEQMKDTYLNSILVFPSYIETVGLPLVEARALGRPIIAADCEYARESVARYDKVAFFDPFDACKLKKEISYATKKR